MSTPGPYYTLSGADARVEPWIQRLDETPNVLNSKTYADLIGMTPLPLRYWHQIPERWLKSDPGFKILLRDYPRQFDSPSWILRPDQYSFVSTMQNGLPEMLIITHHTDEFCDWKSLEEKFEGYQLRWTTYAVRSLPNWPKNRYLNMYDCLFHENLKIGSLYDINYWQKDTLGPLHIHLLQNGVSIYNPIHPKPTYHQLKKSYYGVWYLD